MDELKHISLSAATLHRRRVGQLGNGGIMNASREFSLDGIVINRLIIDDHIAVELMDTVQNSSMRFESGFMLRNSDVTLNYDVTNIGNIDQLLMILGKPLKHCICSKEGHLTIVFDNDMSIYIEHDQCYESWHMYISEQLTIHSIAGEGYAVYEGK